LAAAACQSLAEVVEWGAGEFVVDDGEDFVENVLQDCCGRDSGAVRRGP